MTQTIVNLGTGGAALNGQNGSTAGADSNDALFLDWTGDNAGNYAYLPGVSGNYLSVPDEAALDITGDIDIRVHMAMDDWTPASSIFPLSKWNDGTDERGYALVITNTGTPAFFWSETGIGGSFKSIAATSSIGVSDGQDIWVRVTLDVDNGASGREAKFYTSSDGIAFTQLGTTVTQAGTTSIFSNTQPLRVGTLDGANGMVAAKVYRVQILNGINGTKVLDVDTSAITTGAATSFTALTGQTVTINRSTAGRKSVAVVSPCWLFGTNDYMQIPYTSLLSFNENQDFTAIAVVRFWDSYNGAAGFFGTRNAWVSTSGWELDRASATTVRALVSDGFIYSEASPRPAYAQGTVAVVGMQVDGTANTLAGIDNNGLQATRSIATIGSLESSLPVWIGKTVHAPFSDMELLAVAVFRRALSDVEISALIAYYQARLS
jgi:hypothetical protein